jgi:hypothetical protein
VSLVDRIESMLGALGEKIESFSSDRIRVTIGCSLAAGLSIPVAWFGLLRISVMWEINTPSWTVMLRGGLECVSCFMAAGLLLILAKAHRKIVFDWVLVVVSGSLILAIFDVGRHLDVWRLPAYDLIFVYLRDALEDTVWLSLFTLPFAAAVKYSGSMVRGLKRWHNGQDYSLSISAE